MPAIKLTAFTGEQPRIIPRLLPPAAGQSAVNVRLDDGGLTPMNQSVQIGKARASGDKTIFKYKDTWLSWAGIVHAAMGPVADDRLYYTGDGVPKLRVGADVYLLAVPYPTSRLTAVVSGTGSGDTQTRVYTYTYVTSLGEETEPAPASISIDWKPGQTVTLSGFINPPAGRAITKQRIYRSQTGSSGTFFYFIAERDVSDANYNDSIPVDEFNEALPSAAWNSPPDNLQGLTALPNGMMAAFVGRSLYFCEPYRPHAWPEKYILVTDSDIVGLGAVGTSLIVMTKAQPYLVAGSTPDSMQMVKLEANFPCVNERGIVDMGSVIAYPSTEGLVAATADGQIRLVTANLLSRDDWLDIGPTTFVGGQISGRYVAFYDLKDENNVQKTGALFLDIGETPYLIRTDTHATATYFEVETGALYYLQKGKDDIYRLDAPSGARQDYYWSSKEFHMPFSMSYSAIKIDTDMMISPRAEENYRKLVSETTARNAAKIAEIRGLSVLNGTEVNAIASGGDDLELMPTPLQNVSVGVYADDIKIAQITRTNQAVRLPANFRASRWMIDVQGNVAVSQIVMATTIDELKTIT